MKRWARGILALRGAAAVLFAVLVLPACGFDDDGGDVILIIFDLSGRSAENFLVLQDQLETEGFELHHVVLELTVIDQGQWGEVRFERLSPKGARHE